MKDRLFNSDVKLEYLETQILDEDTRKTAFYEFSKITEMEEKLDKDVYAFNDIEIGNMLKIMKRSSVISVRKTLSILNSYVKWCIINGKRGKFENSLNYMDIFIRTEKDFNQYVSNKQLYNKILTREELEDLLYVPVNASDRAIILSMYEFIGGRELYELRSLTINNINKDTNTVKLTDMDGNIREQSISSRLIKILEDVNENEKTYIYNNGEEDSAGRVIETNLAISNYIIKPSKRPSNDYCMIDYQTLLRRLSRIRKFTDYKNITSSSLRETRIIHEIMDIMEEKQLYTPDDSVYNEAVSRIENQYGITLSRMQIYSIKQKVNQLLTIKEF